MAVTVSIGESVPLLDPLASGRIIDVDVWVHCIVLEKPAKKHDLAIGEFGGGVPVTGWGCT